MIRRNPLAILVTAPAEGFGDLEASHVPVVLHSDIGDKGTLRFHLARANPQWKAIENGVSLLTIFSGPGHYITPSWYATKRETGKVVPTWNYVAVHVRGSAGLFTGTEELLRHVEALTAFHESGFAEPWAVRDAPPGYVQGMTKAIVGIEVAITTIEGKWKVSQNRPDSDRQGVVAGLTGLNTPASLAMAALVDERIDRESEHQL